MPRRGAKSERVLANQRYTKILHRVLRPIGIQVDESLLDESATILGFLADGQFSVSGPYDLGTVFEFALYEVGRDGETIIERYVRTHPPDLNSRSGDHCGLRDRVDGLAGRAGAPGCGSARGQ